MPELPEVESFRRALTREYTGKEIHEVRFHRENIRYPLSPDIKRILTKGSTLKKILRDGKQLVLVTEHGEVQISLGMSGSFIPSHVSRPALHEHVTVVFRDGSVLGFVDPRRFGFWKVRTKSLPHLADPLLENQLIKLFTNKKIRMKTCSIKSLLLDQKLIGGVGNIYALEALHAAGIRPTRRTNTLTAREFAALASALPKILMGAIDGGGSTIATYRRLQGESGEFQEFHKVYDREGEVCLQTGCKGIIKRIKQGGRSSWYCQKCQK